MEDVIRFFVRRGFRPKNRKEVEELLEKIGGIEGIELLREMNPIMDFVWVEKVDDGWMIATDEERFKIGE